MGGCAQVWLVICMYVYFGVLQCNMTQCIQCYHIAVWGVLTIDSTIKLEWTCAEPYVVTRVIDWTEEI